MARVSLADYLAGRRAGGGGEPAAPSVVSRRPLRSVLSQPASQPAPQAASSSALRDLRLGLGAARTATGLARTGSSVADLFGSGERLSDLAIRAEHELPGALPTPTVPGLGANFQTVAGGLQTAAGVADLFGGRTVPGALRTAGGLTSLAGTAGAIPSRIAGPVSAALGIGSGIYDITQGGSGQDLAMGVASLANPAFGTIYAGSQLAGTVMDALTGNRGPFAPTPLPVVERGLNWSAAENASSQISKLRGVQTARSLQSAIEQATDPVSLYGIAAMGGNPNWSALPTGELQFTHRDTPTPEAYRQLYTAARTNPEALRRFISGVSIQTGEGGATTENYPLTDWYRRQLVSLLPASSPLRQDMTGLFAPVPQSYLAPLQQMAGINLASLPLGSGLEFGLSPEDLRGDLGGIYTQPLLSAFGRTPEEYQQLQQLHAKAQAAYTSPDLAQYADRQTYPGYYGGVDQGAVPWPSQVPIGPPEPEPGTPEWYARYVSLESGGYVQAPPGRSVAATIHGGEYVVPAGPLAEQLRQDSRWFISARRGLYQSPVMLDPANDWAVIALPPEEEDDPSPPTVERLRVAGEQPIVVPQELYNHLGRGRESEVERFRVQQYERKHGESWEPWRPGFLPPDEAEPSQELEEDEIGASRAAAGRGARLTPLRDYLRARSSGQGRQPESVAQLV